MEHFILYTPEYRRFYNCTTYSVDKIPLNDRQNFALGLFFVAVGTIELVCNCKQKHFYVWKKIYFEKMKKNEKMDKS